MSEALSRVSEGLPESLKKEYKEVVSEKTSSGSIRHYGIRKSTDGKDPVSAPKLIKAYGYDPKEKNPPAPGVWSTSHGDIPIKVVGIHGRMNGEDFLKIEGANTGVPRSEINFNPVESAEPSETSQLENRLGQMEQRISALESQLQAVTSERDELKKENQQLQQKIAQLESGEKPQLTPDSEEDVTSEETVTVVEAPELPSEQTVTVTEVETQMPPNSTWHDKLNNFMQGRSLHNSVMYYKENGILKREETVEERDDRWKAAAVVIGGIALLLLIKRYGFDWGDDHNHIYEDIRADIGIDDSPDSDNLTEQHQEGSLEHNDIDGDINELKTEINQMETRLEDKIEKLEDKMTQDHRELHGDIHPQSQYGENLTGENGGNFYVESGNGFTHEIQQYAGAHGKSISGSKAYSIYTELRGEFGSRILDLHGTSSDTYTRAQGDLGISAPGSANWFPGARQRLDELLNIR